MSRRVSLDAAVVAAWAELRPFERGAVLRGAAESITARATEFAALLLSAQDEAALGEAPMRGDGPSAATRRTVLATAEHTLRCAAWSEALPLFPPPPPFAARPYVAFASRVPLGIAGIVAPATSPLLGFASAVLPALAFGNGVIAVVTARAAPPALVLAECLERSGMPAGTLAVLAGDVPGSAAQVAKRADVRALVVWSNDRALCTALREHAFAREADVTCRDEPPRERWFDDGDGFDDALEMFTAIKTIVRPAAM